MLRRSCSGATARWVEVAVTNGYFDQLGDLTRYGVPPAVEKQRLKDANVTIIPVPETQTQ